MARGWTDAAPSGPTKTKIRPDRVRRAPARAFIPPQHGAWAMLLVPYVAGVALTRWHWLFAPLLGAWVGGYLFAYFALLAVKTRRVRRIWPQLAVFGAIALPMATVVVVARPQVLAAAPVMAALLAVNAAHAWRRRERALLNDIASVALATCVIPVMVQISPAPIDDTISAAVLVFAYFTGTVFHVKTMIRERGSTAYRRWSLTVHGAGLVVAAWISWPAGVLFALLALRAWALPGRPLSPARVGLVEIAASLLLVVVIALTLAM